MAAGGNLINRFVKVTQANANRVLQSLEAPEKIMNQALIDMQNDLVKVRQSYAEITSSQRRLANERDEAEAEADRWYKRAQLAMKTGNDGLAKEALIRKQQQMEVVNKIQLQIDGQAVAADKLYDGLRALEAKIMEAKQRKAEFVARAKAAESTQKVNDMLSGVTGNTSMDAFKRMEEKVEALEAAAEASAEMAGLALPGSSSSTSEIENEFLLLEGNAAVEEEFTRMKTKMLGGSTEKSKVSIKSEKIFDPSIETEFEALKAKTKATGGEKVTIPVTSSND
jgi:phage shock protein A